MSVTASDSIVEGRLKQPAQVKRQRIKGRIGVAGIMSVSSSIRYPRVLFSNVRLLPHAKLVAMRYTCGTRTMRACRRQCRLRRSGYGKVTLDRIQISRDMSILLILVK